VATFTRASQTMEAAVMPLNPLPPSSTDGVDKLYHQLAKIHTINAAELAECPHLHWTGSTSSPVHASIGRQKSIV
jgi:hypothetical protein